MVIITIGTIVIMITGVTFAAMVVAKVVVIIIVTSLHACMPAHICMLLPVRMPY